MKRASRESTDREHKRREECAAGRWWLEGERLYAFEASDACWLLLFVTLPN